METSMGEMRDLCHDFLNNHGERKTTNEDAQYHATKEENKHKENCKKSHNIRKDITFVMNLIWNQWGNFFPRWPYSK